MPKVIALASATNVPGPAVAMEEDVVASAVLSSLSALQPAVGAVRRLSKAICFISHRTTAGMGFPPISRLEAAPVGRGGAGQARAVMIAEVSHPAVIWRSRACPAIVHPGALWDQM